MRRAGRILIVLGVILGLMTFVAVLLIVPQLSNSSGGPVVKSARVVVAQQNIPAGHRLRMAGGFASAAIDDAGALSRAAEHIGAGVDGVPEDLQHGVIGRQPPFNLAEAAVIAPGDRELQCLVLRP